MSRTSPDPFDLDKLFSGLEDATNKTIDMASAKAEDESILGYVGESIDDIFTTAGDITLAGVRSGLSALRESPDAIARTAMLPALGPLGMLLPDEQVPDIEIPAMQAGDIELAPRMAQLGREIKAREAVREPSAYDDYWITPRDIGGVGSSVGLAVATIASGGAAAPVTMPALAAQAAGGVFGEYAEVLAENDMEFDPRIAQALTLLVAVETIGTKAALVDLPKALASRALRQGLKKKSTEESRKALAKTIAIESGALAAEGAEEFAEEGLEALATIMYKPEFEGLRQSIVSGELGQEEWATLIDLATAGGLKTFVLGTIGGGAGRLAAGAKAGGPRRARRRADEVDAAAAAVRDVRATEAAARTEATLGPEPAAVEEVSPEDVVDAEDVEITASDLDTDEFADTMVSRNPDGVDSLFLTPTGKERKRKDPPSRKEMVEAGIIPEGVKTTKAERQAIHDRLRSARERAAAVTEDAVGPEAVTPPAIEDAPADSELDILENRRRQLEYEREEAEPGSDESFALDAEIAQIEADIQAIDPSVEFSRAEIPDTVSPETSPDVQTSELIDEPGTQMGSMPGGFATSSRTGRRYYVKRYTNAEQTRNEAVANRLYAAAGVNVPNVSLLRDDDGNIVGVASEVVPGIQQGQPTDATDGLVIDAWLANWDVVGAVGDNLLVGPNGEAVRIDQGGALTTRAQGAPKGEAFGPKVGEMESIPAANEAMADASPASIRAGFDALRSVDEQQIKEIVKRNSTGDTAADNRLIATLIKRRRDLLSRESEFVQQSEVEFSRAEADAGVAEVNGLAGTDYVPLTPEEESGLTENERGLKRRAEQRLGRRVVYVRSPSGRVSHNGFIVSRDSNTVYVVVANDITSTAKTVSRNFQANRIAEADQKLKEADRLLSEGKITTAQHERAKKKHAAAVAKAKSQTVTEKQVIEAYEMNLLQTILHENVHLSEGAIGDELTPEQERIRSDAGRILKHIIQTRHSHRRIAMLHRRLQEQKRRLAAKEITEEQYAAAVKEYDSEVTAESLTDMSALSASGIDTLFLDRGRFKAAVNRVKRIANRIGGPKDVRVLTRALTNMERGEGPIPTSPSVPMFSMSTESFLARRPDLQFSRAEVLFDDADEVVVPLADISVAVENPTPENILQLFVSRARWASIGGVKSAPGVKAYDDSAATITAALEKLGITPTPEIIDHVIKNYNKVKKSTTFEQMPDEMRGEMEVFAPAGEVEREMSLLFARTPSPTAAQLQAMPGSPSPRTGVTKAEAKTDSPEAAAEFVKNVIESVEAVDGRVVTTDSDAKIDSLLKKNDVVVYTGGTKPIVHANQTWTDRFARATDYEVIKATTIEAMEAGYHNWYREFGSFFRGLGGQRLLNEAAMIFGVTSAQSAVENNIADTLHIMRLAREHFRDGKPRTVEALMESFSPLILDEKGNKTYKNKKDRDEDKPQRTALERRTRYTADGTAKMFVSGPQLEVIADFYVNGTPEFGGAIKIRTYAGQIAEAAMNRYYPFSVQDRHQAAMYGFFKGTFNRKNGKFSYDKVFRSGDNALEFRYASYLTQRLSNETELLGMTPSMIQAGQWFYTKAGKGPYPEIEAKTDKGLIANFAADNPDLRTGTLESAVKFAEFEIADFMEVMKSDRDDVRFPAADVTVPSFIHGPSGYSQGQAIARDFGARFAMDGPRVQLVSRPNMAAPGLVVPEGMSEFQMDSMIQGIIESVTETDGSIRLLNDMGLPHTPLVSLAGAVDGQPTRGLHMIPLVGSISSPNTARVVGAVVGLGTLQPRMATSRPSPEGKAVTLRIKRADGTPMTADDATGLMNKTSMFAKGNESTWQTASPTNGYVEVTVTPRGEIDDNLISKTFDQISKEFQDEAGIEITGEAFRTEYEVIEQDQYAGIISSSGLGLSSQGPSGVLGRVVSEVTSPVLSTLEASGFGFNRNEFQEGFGLDREVVSSIPTIEFSRGTEDIMPLAEQDEMRRLGGPSRDADGDTVTPRRIFAGQGSLAENALMELDWWAGLSQDERSLMNAWQTGNFENLVRRSGALLDDSYPDPDFYEDDSSLLQNSISVELFTRAMGRTKMYSVLRGLGTAAHGTLALPVMKSALTKGAPQYSKGLGNTPEAQLVFADTFKASLRRLHDSQDVFSPFIDELLFPNGVEDFSNLNVRMVPNRRGTMDADGYTTKMGVMVSITLPKDVDPNEYAADSIEYNPTTDRHEFIVAEGVDVGDVADSFSGQYRLSQDAISAATRAGATREGTLDAKGRRDQNKYEYDDTVARVFGTELLASLTQRGTPAGADIEGFGRGRFLYNDMIKAMAQAPFIETDRLYRAADGVSFTKFARTIPVGGRFRVAGPASASVDQKQAAFFHGKGLFGQLPYLEETSVMAAPTMPVAGTHFIIQNPKTARAIAMSSYKLALAEGTNEMYTGYSVLDDEFGATELPFDINELGETNPEAAADLEFARRVKDQLESPVLDPAGVDRIAREFLDEEGGPSQSNILDRETVAERVSKRNFERPTFPSNELESVIMPGTVFEVVGISPHLVTIKEVEVSPEEAGSIPILPEFSRVETAPELVEDIADMSTQTVAEVEFDNTRFTRFRRVAQDRFIQLDHLQRDVEDAWGEAVDIKSDAVNRLRNMPGRIAHAAERFSDRVMKPLAKQVSQLGLTQAEFGEYATAVHALRVNAEMRASGNPKAVSGEVDSGLSDETANEIIARTKARFSGDPAGLAKLEKTRGRLVSIGRKNLRMARSSGLISDAYYNTMLQMYGDSYVPMWDAFDDETSAANEGAEQFNVPARIMKERTGRTSDSLKGNTKFFEDRMAAMADQRYRVIRKSENNTMLQRLLRFTKEVGRDDLMRIYTPSFTYAKNAKGQPVRVQDPVPNTVFRVMVAGQEVLLEVNNLPLVEAMKASNRDTNTAMSNVVRTLGFFAGMQRFFATQFGNPDFTLTNPARDIQTSIASVAGENRNLASMTDGTAKTLSTGDRLRIVTKGVLGLGRAWSTVLGGQAVGLGGTAQSRREYAQYRALGGRQGFFTDQDPAKSRAALRRIARSAPKTGNVFDFGARVWGSEFNPARKFVEAWSHLNTVLDDGVRFATYQQLVRSGVNPEKAIQTTRDLTVDFSRMGTAGPTINSMYAFANASFQGATKTVRLIAPVRNQKGLAKINKKGVAVVGAYFTVGMLLEAINMGDEEDRDGNGIPDWEEIPDYQKDGNFHIPIGGGEYIKFPVAYGLAIPYVAGRRMMRYMMGKEGLGSVAANTLTATYTQMNPFGSEEIRTDSLDSLGSSVGRIMSPSALDPFIDVATNQDWRGSRIYNEPFPSEVDPMRSQMGRDQKGLIEEITGFDLAQGTADLLSRATGAEYSDVTGEMVRPGKLDYQPEAFAYLLRAQFTGAGATADRIGKFFQTLMSGEEVETNDIPGLRRFYTNPNSGPAKERSNRTAAYEYREIAREADAQIKRLVESRDKPGIQSILDDPDRGPEYRALPVFKAWDKYRKETRDTVKKLKAAGATEEKVEQYKDRRNATQVKLEAKIVRKVQDLKNEQAKTSTN